MQADVHFTTIASQFEQDVYGSSRGYIRWNVLWEDLITEFYNRNAMLFKDILRGDFSLEASNENTLNRGWDKDSKPLYPETAMTWLDEFGMRVISKAGIRIFHDHIAEKDTEGRLEQLLETEKTLRKQEPFASLAQHIHFICQRLG